MTFILSFLSIFCLVRYLTKSTLAGVTSGVIYSFSPYHIAHMSQPSLSNMQWMPLFFLSLFVFERDRTVFFALVSALLWGVVAYSDAYYGFMCAIAAGLFMLFYRLKFIQMLQIAIFSAIVIIPFFMWSYSLWYPRLMYEPMPIIARWTDYILPIMSGGSEHWLFICPVWLILAVIGIRRHNLFWVGALLVSLILSLVEPICPIFRASAKWGVMVLLSISVLAGYEVENIRSKLGVN